MARMGETTSDEPDKRPRRRRVILGSVVLFLISASIALVWAATRGPAQFRHATARSLRAALGPPEPSTWTYDEDQASPSVWADGDWLSIPEAVAGTGDPDDMAPPRRPARLRGVSFVLLLGADNRNDRVVGRTDTMILAAFRDRDGKVAAFSVPRDLWISLPDVGTLHEEGRDHARISSVVRVGEVRLGEGEGIPLLRRVLLDELGVRVDRFARVDFDGFVALVDELGGVDVDVECPIMDCFWTHGTNQPCEMMSIAAGRRHMNGATALQFVRSRHGTGDRDRTRRQQAVMLAFARKVRARGLRGIRGLWRVAEPHVTTDLERDDAIYYASFALETHLSEVRGFSIARPITNKQVTEDGKHVLILDRDRFDEALAQMFEDELPALRGRSRCPAPDAALTFR